jgi:hypothetical protein
MADLLLILVPLVLFAFILAKWIIKDAMTFLCQVMLIVCAAVYLSERPDLWDKAYTVGNAMANGTTKIYLLLKTLWYTGGAE